jgi:hypothetical protein
MLDSEITKLETDPIILDSYLKESLIYLRDNPTTRKGVVSAAIIDGSRCSFGIPTPCYGSNYWYHAERDAIQNFYESYKVLPSPSASISISLSPCANKRISKHREGVCCSKLLLGKDPNYPNLNIRRVHIGFLDPWQVESIKEYEDMGFDISITQDPNLKESCQKLFEYFTDHYGEDTHTYLNTTLKEI